MRLARSLVLAGLLAVGPGLAHAAPLHFTSNLDHVVVDDGTAVFSAAPVGAAVSGTIDDVTGAGTITVGGLTQVFGCCIAAGGFNIDDDHALDVDEAALASLLLGTPIAPGTVFDVIDIEGDAATAGGGRIEIGLSFLLAPGVFSGGSPANYPPSPSDVIARSFFIAEFDAAGDETYSAAGLITNAPFAVRVPATGTGLLALAGLGLLLLAATPGRLAGNAG